jgi:DNA-binding response OmpR family regulator
LIGADDYIVKPFNSDELVARVRRLLVRNSSNGGLSSGERKALRPSPL